MKKTFYSILITLLIFSNSFSQSENLGQFDDKLFHFGFALSYNNSGFNLDKSFNPLATGINDSLQSVLVLADHGFSLGVVTSINVNPNFKIRFVLPTLSFLERNIEFKYLNHSSGISSTQIKDMDATYLDFPILFKFRTNRIHNFAMYGITGFRYGINMTSNTDVNNSSSNPSEQIIKITDTDFGTEVGGGIDLFLNYFKFGIELKLAVGMKNLLYLTPQRSLELNETPTNFDNAIESLRSRVWTLSLTFEG